MPKSALRVISEGAVIIFVGLILEKLLGYGYRFALARFLGPNDYGLISMGFAVFGLVAIIALVGLDQGVERNVGYYISDREKLKGIFRAGLKITVPWSIITGALMFIFSNYIAVRFFSNPALTNIIRVLALGIPLSVLLEVLLSNLKGYKLAKSYVKIRNVVEPGVRLGITVLFLVAGFKLFGVAAAYVASFIIVAAFSLYLLKRKIPFVFSSDVKSKPATKELFSYSWPLLLTGVASSYIIWIDTLMLGYFRTASEVGLYNAAVPIAGAIAIIMTAICGLYTPVMSGLFSKNNHEEMKKVYTSITRWIFVLSIPMAVFAVTFARQILVVLFGSAYAPAATALAILSAGYFISSVFGPSRLVLTSIAKTKLKMFNANTALAFAIILNLLLIPKYGVSGAAVATGSALVLRSLMTYIEVWYITKLQPFNFNFLKIFVSAAVAAAALKLISIVLVMQSRMKSIALFGIFLGIYVLMLYITKSFVKDDISVLADLEKKLKIKEGALTRFIRVE